MDKDSFEHTVEQQCAAANILIVEDSPILIEMYKAILEGMGKCYCAETYSQALALLREQVFDVALLDHHLPDGNGLDLCSLIRKEKTSRQLPVVMITGSDDKSLEQKYWEAGCSDFVNKPVEANTLRHRVHSQLKLKFAFDLLQRMSSHDQLTGLHNRHYLESVIDGYAKVKSNNLSLLLLDIDFFKRYNDEYGHQPGDKCLSKVAGILRLSIREPDTVSVRYGGEEFLVVLPNATFDEAVEVGERIRRRVEQASIVHAQAPLGYVTVSVGVSSSSDTSPNWKQLIREADECLYKAKAMGRNRVEAGNG